MHSNQDRLLMIKNILLTETDSERTLSIQQMIDRLREIFPTMKLDPRTIRTDIEALNDNGFSITEKKGKYGRILYSYEDRLFKPYELRYLIDAVLDAKFISRQHKQGIMNRLVNLSGKSYHAIIKNLKIANVSDVPYDHTLIERLELLNHAIDEGKEVRFKCGSLGIGGEFIAETEDSNVFQPYSIFWFDTYYVVGKLVDTNQIVHYPLSHLRYICLTKQSIATSDMTSFCLDSYIIENFYLFTGELQQIEVSFEKYLLDEMLRRFPDAEIAEKDNHYILKVSKRMTEDHVNWFLGLGASATVLGPTSLTNYMREKIQEALQRYEVKEEVGCS